jgi:hypothetical protein
MNMQLRTINNANNTGRNESKFLASAWRRLQDPGVMPDAASMRTAAEKAGVWPVSLRTEPLLTTSGLKARADGVVGSFAGGDPDRCLGIVGSRYRATAVREWNELVEAACRAGAKPTGCFGLRGGSRIVATFQVGDANGLGTNLILADAFDGSLKLTCGTLAIRFACMNQMSMVAREGVQLRHTASLEHKVKALADSIEESIETGKKVRDTFHAATDAVLSRDEANRAFDILFPEADEDVTPAVKTRANNVRDEARAAAALPINKVGPKGNLATLWNAATYLVDRNVNGTLREPRGGADLLDSMIFGTRATRVQQVQTLIEVILADGTVRSMPATQAIETGVDPRLVGRAILDELVPGYRD